MVMIAPIVIGAGIAAAGSWWGRRSANKANKKEAEKNRQFQERMRNTEWQSAVTDMQKAGINPALAYSQGGASSPSGSVAAKQESELGDAAGSALNVGIQAQQMKLLKAQTDNVVAEGVGKDIGNRMSQMDLNTASAKYGFYFDKDGKPRPQMLEMLQAEQAKGVAGSAREVSELNLSRLRGPEMEAIADLFRRFGESGKGVQQIMPLLLQFMRARGGR